LFLLSLDVGVLSGNLLYFFLLLLCIEVSKRNFQGHRTLGFSMTGDGTSNEHKRVMKEKGLDYAMAIRNSTLQRGECNMAYGAYYIPSLAYGTPSTTLSYKECKDV
jgi:hypothetical protein